jgi:uncharacterized protein YccT (UPF0319 family)
MKLTMLACTRVVATLLVGNIVTIQWSESFSVPYNNAYNCPTACPRKRCISSSNVMMTMMRYQSSHHVTPSILTNEDRLNCKSLSKSTTILSDTSNENASSFQRSAARMTAGIVLLSHIITMSVIGVPTALAVSGGGLDYAGIDISGQDFSKGNYKGKDFTQGKYNNNM